MGMLFLWRGFLMLVCALTDEMKPSPSSALPLLSAIHEVAMHITITVQIRKVLVISVCFRTFPRPSG